MLFNGNHEKILFKIVAPFTKRNVAFFIKKSNLCVSIVAALFFFANSFAIYKCALGTHSVYEYMPFAGFLLFWFMPILACQLFRIRRFIDQNLNRFRDIETFGEDVLSKLNAYFIATKGAAISLALSEIVLFTVFAIFTALTGISGVLLFAPITGVLAGLGVCILFDSFKYFRITKTSFDWFVRNFGKRVTLQPIYEDQARAYF